MPLSSLAGAVKHKKHGCFGRMYLFFLSQHGWPKNSAVPISGPKKSKPLQVHQAAMLWDSSLKMKLL
jgi:hypothetical protein